MTLRGSIEFLLILVLAALVFGAPSRFAGVLGSASQIESESEAKLQSEQKNSAALTDKLSEAEAKITQLENLSATAQARTDDLQHVADQATAEAAELKKQAAAERNANSQIKASLESEQVQAVHDRSVDEDTRRSFEAAAIESQARLQSEQKRSAALAEKLFEAEAKIRQLQGRSTKPQAKTEDLQHMADQAITKAGELRKQAHAERKASARPKRYKNETQSTRADRYLRAAREHQTQALSDGTVHRDGIGSSPRAGTAASAVSRDLGATGSSPTIEDEGYTAMDYSPYDTSEPTVEPVDAGRASSYSNGADANTPFKRNHCGRHGCKARIEP